MKTECVRSALQLVVKRRNLSEPILMRKIIEKFILIYLRACQGHEFYRDNLYVGMYRFKPKNESQIRHEIEIENKFVE